MRLFGVDSRFSQRSTDTRLIQLLWKLWREEHRHALIVACGTDDHRHVRGAFRRRGIKRVPWQPATVHHRIEGVKEGPLPPNTVSKIPSSQYRVHRLKESFR